MNRTRTDPIVSAPSETPLRTKLALMTASIAAIGAVFGAFYLGTVFSSAPLETKSVATAETNGSASTQDNPRKEETQTAVSAPVPVETSDAANCREQTWPYIARPCLANEKGEQRGVRVISTDKVADPVINVVEAPPDSVINRKAAPSPEPPKTQAATVAPVAANNSASVEASSLNSGASLGAIAISPAASTPEPVVAAAPPPDEPNAQPAIAPITRSQPAAQTAVATESQAVPDKRAEKSKRKAMKRQDERFKENERFRTTTAQADDVDEDEPVIERRSGRMKGRIVERWTERDTVSSRDGGGTRRVVVTSREDTDREHSVPTERGGGFPNIFGAIFGFGN